MCLIEQYESRLAEQLAANGKAQTATESVEAGVKELEVALYEIEKECRYNLKPHDHFEVFDWDYADSLIDQMYERIETVRDAVKGRLNELNSERNELLKRDYRYQAALAAID